MMNKDTLDKLTRAFLNCDDLDDEDVEEALRGFGINPDEAWARFKPMVDEALDEQRQKLEPGPERV